MKARIFFIAAIAASIFAGCSSAKTAASADSVDEISWAAFCNARGYQLNEIRHEAITEYLDCWRGSTEEAALIKAGINIDRLCP